MPSNTLNLTILSIVMPLLGIAAFLFVESSLRQGEMSKSLRAGPQDKNSTRYLGIAIGTCILSVFISPLLNFFKIAYIGRISLLIAGSLCMLIGLVMRVTAALSLGKFYTRVLTSEPDQHLHTTGIYQYIRNPGYLGSILLFGGAGLAANNYIILTLGVLLPITAYLYRIEAEESLLQEVFGEEFTRYKEKTWRLIPFIY